MDSPSDNQQDSREDHIMNKIIQRAMESMPDDAEWPPPDIIAVYLDGTATEEQCEIIYESLSRSRQFRRALADMAAQMKTERASPQETTTREPIPVMPKVLAEISSQTRPVIYRHMPVIAAAAVVIFAAIATTYVLFRTPDQQRAGVSYVDLVQAGLVERQRYETFSPRGEDSTRRYDNAKEAALSAFVGHLYYNYVSDSVLLHDTLPVEQPFLTMPVEGRHISVRIRDENDSILMVYEPIVPTAVVSDSAAELSGWIITVPSLVTWHCTISDTAVDLQWDSTKEQNGCITVTYPADGGYRFAAARVFRFKH